MRPVVRTALIAAVVVVVGIAGFVGGWYAHTSSSSTPGPANLTIIAAGSLAPILPSIASAFQNATPGVNAPAATQLYEGSTAAASALTLPGQPYDIFVAADFRLIPQKLEPPTASVASWEAVFAIDPVVLAYEPGAAGLSGINSSNWYEKIVNPGVTLGTPNASSDPLGANAIFTLELTDGILGAAGAFYGHFYTGGLGGLGVPTANTKIVSENVAATALSTGEVSTFLIYRSYAEVDHLTYVSLNDSVNLGSINATEAAAYHAVSTTELSGTGTEVKHAAPVLFSLTVPNNAPDYGLGLLFSSYLLSNATATTWASDGFIPLAPIWTDQPTHLPPGLTGTAPSGVAPLPAYLAALLA